MAGRAAITVPMTVHVKFCGLTRREDVDAAIALGANYLGVVFAGGPRNQSFAAAAVLFERLAGEGTVQTVGVVAQDADQVVRAVQIIPHKIIQLHGNPAPTAIRQARDAGASAVWAVLPVGADGLPEGAETVFRVADAIVLDTRSASGLGGTGATFDWERAAAQIAPYRTGTRVVVAGGLKPDNVAAAVRALRPDIVDVSSGVEQAPGVKDRELMRRFVAAAHGA
jgi:phosphoribosylanthranilate isomerase